jgi:exodeoxyribonuclease V alpha subunit
LALIWTLQNDRFGHLVRIRNFDLSGSYLEAAVPDSDQIGKFRHLGAINPSSTSKPQIKMGERIFRVGDRVIHRRNNYDLEVFNGDIGYITAINNESLAMVINFLPDGREVEYLKENIVELDLAYAITIHKSQGSEFSVVIIPVLTQHFKMLYRNLIYTGLTRTKKLAVFVGTRRAMAMAVRQQDTALRQTALEQLLKGD